MATPTFDPRTEIFLGSWVDITSDTRMADEIEIARGRADQASVEEPSSCRLRLDNRTGNYSSRNPMGAYYPELGRNTQVRVLDGDSAEDRYMTLPGGLANDVGGMASYATTPDAAGLDITGDIDIRIEVDPFTWRPTSTYGLIQKSVSLELETFSWSWMFTLTTDGNLSFKWTPNATIAAEVTATSTAAVPSGSGRLVLRVTLDVDNGAGGCTVRFYTATSINGSFTQLGADVVVGGTTSIYSSAAPLEIGRAYLGTSSVSDPDRLLQGKVYRAQVRNGIGGSSVSSPDFTLQDSGTTSFDDAQSRTWTLQGNAVVANPNARFHGEVSAWPQVWDKTARDISTPIEAYGIMGRLGQGHAALRSVMYRALTSDDTVVAYWPCEDGEDATGFASALPGHPAMVPNGTVEMAQYAGFRASDPLPEASGVWWSGKVPAYTVTGETQVRFLMRIPSGGPASLATVCRVRCTGTAAEWELSVGVTGTVRLRAFDQDYTVIHDSGFTAHAVNGKALLMSLQFVQDGSDITYSYTSTAISAYSSIETAGTVTGRTFGRATNIGMNVADQVLTDTPLGHISVQNIAPINGLSTADHDQLAAYSGETSSGRMLRLCHEEGVPMTIIGDSTQGTRLGPQLPGTLLDLLREAAASDMGLLHEPREFFGLAYRTRDSLYAQDAALELDYASRHMFEIEPTEDDDATRNDITVSRINGSSARAELTTGALSTLPPPDGVGRYDDEASITLYRDTTLPDQASWRLHLGTVDEARYPVVAVHLASAAFLTDPTLAADAKALDVGGKVTVSNLPAHMPPDDVRQIVQGMTETLTPFEWVIRTNLAPASPYDVAVWDDTSGPGEARYSSDGSLTADLPLSGTALILNGVSPGGASTPDTASLDITGDIDIRVHLTMDDWTPASTQTLVSKSTSTGNQRSWQFNINSSGNLVLIWSATGSATMTATSTVAPTIPPDGVLWVRVTLDVNNGAAGRDIKFYTSTDGENTYATWTQLGATVTQAGTTSIFNSTAGVVVGAIDAGTTNRLAGNVDAVHVHNGIGGTGVISARFGEQVAGTTSFVDGALTWTINAPGVIGEVATGMFPDTISITTPSGPLWDGTDGPFDIMIGGERMTVTKVELTTTPQLFTVTRSVNGIRKAHVGTFDVDLFKPGVYAL